VVSCETGFERLCVCSNLIVGRGHGPSPRRTIVVVAVFVSVGIALVATSRNGSVGDWVGDILLAGSAGVVVSAVPQHRREARERKGLEVKRRFPPSRPDEAYMTTLKRWRRARRES
jgi:hypothetical protein